MNDIICIGGIICAIGFGAWGAIANSGAYFRIGSVVAALSMCLGFAYFGWRPYFGGSHDPATFFGSAMLTFGVLAWLFLRGLSTTTRVTEKR